MIVVSVITVTLICKRQSYVNQGFCLSPLKQSSEDSTNPNSLKSTLLASRFSLCMSFVPHTNPGIDMCQCESRFNSSGNIFPHVLCTVVTFQYPC
ncbi:hypothetical protein NPIL_9851 [Nephila pilipes]|uniref:Uncharacterized protein n=1 Tax=Nephila pilipes TaxID=299642 RepID=A0A8X6TWT5_NEPPI|nr:hypothetical protein NPIL_9851 [Nephila pilipes]